MKTMLLTNKSSRVYVTTKGNFHPGTSKEFDEKEAIQLLGYSNEIVRADKALGKEFEVIVEAKDQEIDRLGSEIEDLQARLTQALDGKTKNKAK